MDEAAHEPSSPREGLLWLFGGAAITFITYVVAAPGGTYVVAWGAMLYGAVKLVGAIADKADGADMPYADRVRLGQEMCVRSMYFIAQTQGTAEAEIDVIVWRITDQQMSADRRIALRAEAEQGCDFLADVQAQRELIPPAFRDIILESAAQIAGSGAAMKPETEARLRGLAEALDLPAPTDQAT